MDEQGGIILGMVIVAQLRAKGRDDLVTRITKDPDFTTRVSMAAMYAAKVAGSMNKEVLNGIVDAIIEADEGVRHDTH